MLRSVVVESLRPWSLAVYAISCASGEKLYASLPPNGGGGTSYVAPGMRSRGSPPSALTTKRCDLVPSSQAFQWRYSKWSAMFALTLLVSRALSRSALQASVEHVG